jgi:hypothetical protein
MLWSWGSERDPNSFFLEKAWNLYLAETAVYARLLQENQEGVEPSVLGENPASLLYERINTSKAGLRG